MDVFSKLIQERIIFIDDVIDDDLANAVIAQMLYLDSISQKPINIYINSPGGSVTSGLAIYDVSKLVKSEINTVCVGKAASMGAILMLMGKKRSITRHGRMMLHQVQSAAIGTVEEMRSDMKITESLQDDLYKIVEEKTKLTNVKELFYFDKWFNAQECFDSGIVNEIL